MAPEKHRAASSVTDSEMRELTDEDFASAITARARRRIIRGASIGGSEIAALRRFVRLTPEEFARVIGVGVQSVRRWERDANHPSRSAVALMRIVARRPGIIRELRSK